MRRSFQFFTLAIAIAMFMGFPNLEAKGDDSAPTSQPSKQTVTVKVVDRQQHALSGEAVKMTPTAPKSAATGADAPAKVDSSKPIAEGTTDDTGTVVFKDIPTGSYVVQASGEKGKGHNKTNVHAKDVTTTVVATLKTPKNPAAGESTTQPTTQP